MSGTKIPREDGARLHLLVKIPNVSRDYVCPVTPMALPSRNDRWSVSTALRDQHHAEQIRRGNHSAFEALFRSYYPRLCRFAFRLTGARAAAEEAVQDVFVKIWKNRSSWMPKGSVRSYLFQSVKNQVITVGTRRDFLEYNEAEVERALSHLPGPLEELHHKEMQVAVDEAIELLPPRCRLIFLMHRVEDLTYEEIAEVLGISVKTVENQIGRALRTLRKLLVPYLPLLTLLVSVLP